MSGEKVLRAYNVWPSFPSVSISGTACALACKHCVARYLELMIPATTPENLRMLGEKFAREGKPGLLVSGGCDKAGRMLNMEKFLPALKRLHGLGLIIKLHTGLVDEGLARGIADAGVDIASMEFVGDAGTVSEIFGIPATPEDYTETFLLLKAAGVPFIAPHVAVGLHHGALNGERRALSMLRKVVEPSTIAIIAFRPTTGTAMERDPAPRAEDVKEVVAHARSLFPETKIVLGALRPRGPERCENARAYRLSLELAALDGGADGIEVPSPGLLEEARARGYRIKWLEAYGVLPVEYEGRVAARWA
ncbi:MAG: hypothetical protein HZB92_04565 [Euryarchaeota archaeon]|nr:hypothetical protein [Euryarchaeota archaeon]